MGVHRVPVNPPVSFASQGMHFSPGSHGSPVHTSHAMGLGTSSFPGPLLPSSSPSDDAVPVSAWPVELDVEVIDVLAVPPDPVVAALASSPGGSSDRQPVPRKITRVASRGRIMVLTDSI